MIVLRNVIKEIDYLTARELEQAKSHKLEDLKT